KCWYCHNKYAKTGPSLKDIFKRDRLRSGQPVSDAAIIEKIRQGGQLMPTYRYTLSDPDLTDLLSYFKSDKCCFEGDEPPSNPRYRAAGAGSVTNNSTRRALLGGVRGTVHGTKREPLEGIMVQLISTSSGIRSTRYDEAGWRSIVRRMMTGAGSPLINVREPGPQSRGRAGRPISEELEIVAKWLARVRGPDSKDAPLHYLPPPRGVSTRVVVTEYELPRQLLAPHDVHGDSQGNIWYTAHR